MLFKRFIQKTGLVASIAALFSGCSIREAPLPLKGMEPSSVSLEAFDRAGETADRFIQGQATAEEILTLENAVLESLDAFLSSTKGSMNEDYSSTELKYFIETYFLKKVSISFGLLSEFFFLKRAAIGGSTSRITRDEIQKTKQLVRWIGRSARALVGYMPIERAFFFDENYKGHPYQERRDLWIGILQGLLQNLNADEQTTYEPERLVYLYQEVAGITAKRDNNTAKSLDSIRTLVLDLRHFLFASPLDRTFKIKDWKEIIAEAQTLLEIWFSFQDFHSSKQGFFEDSAREKLMSFSLKLTDFFEKRLFYWSGFLPHSEFVKWYTGSEFTREFLETSYGSKDFVQSVLKFASSRFLSSGDVREPRGFTTGNVLKLREILNGWNAEQKLVTWPFRLLDKKRCLDELAVELSRARKENRSEEATVLDLMTRLQESHLVSKDPFVLGFSSTSQHTLADLERAFSERVFYTHAMTPIIRAYRGRDRYPTLVGFEVFVREVWPILKAAQFVDNVNVPVVEAALRFREANLFTLAANGDAFLQPSEGIALMGYVASAGISATRAYNALSKLCATKGRDLLGKPFLEPICARSYLFGRTSHPTTEFIRANHEYLFRYLDKLPKRTLEAVLKNLQWASRRYGYHQTRWIEASDINSLMMLYNYIETIYLRFDQDQSQTISFKESRLAFRVFAKELGETLGIKVPDASEERSQLEAIFTWLLAKGYEPGSDPRLVEGDEGVSSRFWSQIRRFISTGEFISWWVSEPWEFEADRSRIIGILASLSRRNIKSMPRGYHPPE